MSDFGFYDIEAWSWLVWTCVGVVCGIVAALAVGGRHAVWIDICVGLVSSLVGSMACALVIGLETSYDMILATMCGVLLAGVVLWIMDEVVYRTPPEP